MKETDRSILRSKSDSDVTNNPRVPMHYNYTVDPRTGWRFYTSSRPTTSSSSSHWEQHDDWKSNKSWDSFLANLILDWTVSCFLVQVVISLTGNLMFLASNGECGQIHQSHATFRHAQSLLSLCVYSHITHTRGSRLEYNFCVLTLDIHTSRSARHVPYFARNSTPRTCSPSLTSSGPSISNHTATICLLHQGDTSAELPPPTVYEPNWIVDNQIVDDQDNMHFTEDDQITELEDRVKCLSLPVVSAHDSAESIATPPELIGLRWRTTSCSAGFTTVPTGARSKCRTITSLSLWTRKLDVQFISRSDNLSVQGNLSQCFQVRAGWDQDTFSVRDQFPLKPRHFWMR